MIEYRMAGQTKLASFFEANINLIVSYPITWAAYVWIAPTLLGIQVEHKQAFGLIMMFSVISVIRQFVLRRVFNFFEKRRIVPEPAISLDHRRSQIPITANSEPE